MKTTQVSRILDYIEEHPGARTSEIATALKLKLRNVAATCYGAYLEGKLGRSLASPRQGFKYTLAKVPATPDEPVETVEPVKSVEPMKFVKSVESVKSAEPVKFVESVESVKSAEPVKFVESDEIPSLGLLNGVPTTTSLNVAHVFGKRHANIIRDIEDLRQALPSRCRLNFELTYLDICQPNGGTRTEAAYFLTRDGFTLLAMGFTGKKALQFKLAYIDAFNKMEAALKQSPLPPPAPATTSFDSLLDDTARQFVDRLFDRIKTHLDERRPEIGRYLLPPPATLISDPFPYNIPVPVVTPRKRLPRVGVVGLLSVQSQEIAKDFDDCLDLMFWKDGPLGSLKALGINCEVVFVHVQHISHSTHSILKKVGANLRLIDGGLSALKDAITEYYVKRDVLEVEAAP
jgi:Rha family phage regulatory protein